MNNILIAIVGPTASGKSSLGVNLAKKYNGEIISADSRQIYKGINVGADQITEEKMQGIPHHLLDIADPNTIFSVVDYKKEAEAKIKEIQAKNKLPFLIGGTGMYIDSVIYNIQYPPSPPNTKIRKKLEQKSTDQLLSILQRLDPERAKTIDQKNKRRIIRAIEINKTTNKPIQPINKKMQYHTLILGIQTNREELYKKIEDRFYKTLENKHEQEVKYLHQEYKVSWERIEEIGLNYKYMAQYLQQKITEKEMIQKSIKAIQQYSKRQQVWFQKNKDIIWINTQQQAETEIDKFL